jgi:hypothetical protein
MPDIIVLGAAAGGYYATNDGVEDWILGEYLSCIGYGDAGICPYPLGYQPGGNSRGGVGGGLRK